MSICIKKGEVVFNGNYPIKALDIEEFKIMQGEWVNILGPSGSGKTTLLNVIGGFEELSEGIIEVNGKNLTIFSKEQMQTFRRTTIGYIFQDFRLFEQFTVLENTILPQLPFEKRKNLENKARIILNQLQMGHRLNSLPGELSGGEKQRTAIARALIHKPNILLCDEPTGNLDKENRERILDILKELHKEGMTIILVTHDLEIAEWGDRKLYIRDGQIQESVSL
ncbi:ABC transporter ATP-binding protein [Bacillus sp. EB01]|uniref:ABC transporter ATP-binding protein n=1 Tax=Bacillus sp. EB01 TaxID=1347086 RepID=UPI00069379F2|nr:ABC transporter ATP-binding protein [Bacillus sp. EB01]